VTQVLSILIPSLVSRDSLRKALLNKIMLQIGPMTDVEVLVWIDNKRRSIGRKRDDLVQMASGKFLAILDDDDDVSGDYVAELRSAALANPEADVIVFDQIAQMGDWKPFRVRFGIEFENQAAADGGGRDITRKPWHLCAWRSDLAKMARFPDISYGEDAAWAAQLWPKVKRQVRIDKVLHHYRWSPSVTEAPTTL